MSDNKTPTKTMSVEAKFFVVLTAALAIYVWWLLSDREPTQKEMTFAYRKHIAAIDDGRNSKELADLRQHPHAIELIKQRCDKLDAKRYRCEAIVMINDHLVENPHAAGNAIYSRNAKGWGFEATGEK